MTDWLSLALPYLSALILIAALGAPIAFGLRVRGFMFAVVAVPGAFAVIAVGSIVASLLGARWSFIVPLALSLAIGGVLWSATLRNRTNFYESPARGVPWTWVAVFFSGLITMHTLTNGIPAADSVSQTYDAVFHLNATKHILDTGVASPLGMDLTSPGNPSFYPTLWHATTALIVQVSGASIAIATNAMTFFTVSVVWGIGAVALGRAVAGPGRISTLSAGIMATVFPNLPMSLAAFGVLYPNFLAMTLMPYVLVGCAHLWAFTRARNVDPSSPLARVLLTFGGLGAAALAHPNALHVAFLLTIGFTLTFVIIRVRRHGSRTDWLLASGLTAGSLGVGLALWIVGRTTVNPWGGSEGPFGALLEAFGTAPRFDGHNWLVTGLIALGCVVAVRRVRLWPYLISLVLALAFYVLAEGFPANPIRELFLSPWYSDPWRLAAMLPLAMLPLGVVGLKNLLVFTKPSIMRFGSFFISARARVDRLYAWLVLVLGVMLAATSLYPGVAYVSTRYTADTESPRLLSNDEMALLDRVETAVPEDGLLLVNPWNGSSLAYALAGRDVTLPHMTGTYDPRIWTAAQGIAQGSSEACAAAEQIGATHVLDFGTGYIFSYAEPEELEQISGIEATTALTEVDREGEAVLYEITGCKWRETP